VEEGDYHHQQSRRRQGPYDRTINRRKILAIINALFSLIYKYFSRILKVVQKNISLRGG
jgi:hypothetical protein